MSKTFKPVRDIQDGGHGVPVPVYWLTHRGHILHVLVQGAAKEALDWLEGRSAEAAVICVIDGEQTEVARGRAALAR